MATGDLKGSLRKLDQHLRLLNYPREVDYTGLAKGDPSAFLPVVSHAFISYSSYLAEHLVGFGVELAGKNDLRFIESVYKSKLQPKNKAPTHEPQLKDEKILPDTPMPQPVHCMRKPFVERHVSSTAINRSGSSSSASDAEELDSHSCASEEETVKGLPVPLDKVDTSLKSHYNIEAAESWKLKCLESQLVECQKKLESLLVFEERLKVLEREMAGKVIIDRKEWDNLVSRVVLLETEMVLRSRQEPSASNEKDSHESKCTNPHSIETRSKTPESLHHNSSGYSSVLSSDTSPNATNINSFVLTEVSKASTKERLERITIMMKETAALLKSTDNPL
ncbi:centrosomal protein of 44 kDa isoform X2 [Lepisosteus oculatus]|uniref:centrosomal protein of 44 kDa isoform X2 n=1 Tax=Lepisosteus oculatus TaxID=7918 RepID=UPI0035F51752